MSFNTADQLAIFYISDDGEPSFIKDIDYDKDDPDHGIPSEYFEDGYAHVYLDTHSGSAEWVPAVGPAPCWVKEDGANMDRMAMVRELMAWFEKTY